MKTNRRDFIKKSVLAGAAIGFSASSYARIIGANDRVRVACVGFSDRFKSSHVPPFKELMGSMNFEMVGVSDIWKKRREDGKAFIDKALGSNVTMYRNNDELYASKNVDAVFMSTADFQHALHTIEAVKAGCDIYAEKPLAETMADNRAVLKAVKESGKIVQIGSQRRSGQNSQLKEEDIDWKRYLLNRPFEAFDPRKYLEYRLFWPYSSGIPGQWMSHQIDTVHWFSGLAHPRSAVANGGIYQWKDGRTNADTLTVVFDYGPADDLKSGFQVQFTSRFSNGAGGTKELYYSNGGMINLDTNEISSEGGMGEREAKAMGMQANLLQSFKLEGDKVETAANTGGDPLTFNHIKNWMECVRSRKQPNAPIEAGYQHSIATIMSTAAYRTGARVTFDEKTQEVLANGKPFLY